MIEMETGLSRADTDSIMMSLGWGFYGPCPNLKEERLEQAEESDDLTKTFGPFSPEFRGKEDVLKRRALAARAGQFHVGRGTSFRQNMAR